MNKTLFSTDEILEKEILYPDDDEYDCLTGIKGEMFAPPHQKCRHCDAIVVAKAPVGLMPRMDKHLRENHFVEKEDGEVECPNCDRNIPVSVFEEEGRWKGRCPYCGRKMVKIGGVK